MHWGIALSIVISIAAAFLRAVEPGAVGGRARAGRGCFGRDAHRAHVAHGPPDQERDRRPPEGVDAQAGRGAWMGVFLYAADDSREGMETALLMGTLLFQVHAVNVMRGPAGTPWRRLLRGCGRATATG